MSKKQKITYFKIRFLQIKINELTINIVIALPVKVIEILVLLQKIQ